VSVNQVGRRAGAAGILSRPLVYEAERWRDIAWHVLGVRGHRTSRTVVAEIRLMELAQVAAQFGSVGVDTVLTQLAHRITPQLAPRERIGYSGNGSLMLLLPDTAIRHVKSRLDRIGRQISATRLSVETQQLSVTPAIGWAIAPEKIGPETVCAERSGADDLDALLERAEHAAGVAAQHLDLTPRNWASTTRTKRRKILPGALRTPLQVLATPAIGLLLPFLVLAESSKAGVDLVAPTYVAVCLALVLTALVIRLETYCALDPERPPKQPATPYPAASAIIAAYLPNEADTIVETVQQMLKMDYPAQFQVVLAYNTPRRLPVEDELRELAAADPRLVVLEVAHSQSKAQNINAALSVITGEFVGIFDADHHPDETAFRRAWRWLSHGADVVQGHCVIRNGHESLVAHMVAVEFESIYAVSHPGRTQLHGFGLFGGSNGYWRTSALRETRMRGEMLTEDIDSSIRALLDGRKVVTDPALLSRELAPTTIGALWNQRMRWAQGWFQVSLRHLPTVLRSSTLTAKNKIGLLYLLGWREIYPWISLQIFPLLAFIAWHDGTQAIELNISIFVLASLFTLSVGPAQVLFAYRLAAPEIRRNRRWFWSYLVVSLFFYTPFKNIIARVAQVKEFSGERRWVVTPRSAAVPATIAGEHA